MAVNGGKIIRSLGVGLYVFVTRAAMTVAVVFTALFFILNSSPFPDMLAGALKGVIPGRFEFGRIQASPIPWFVDVTDFAIRTPTGKPIIEAGLVRARVKLLPLVNFLFHMDQRKLPLEFASARLYDFKVLLQFDEKYHLELVDAFYMPVSKPPNPNPMAVFVGIDEVTGTNGHVFLEFPGWDLRVDGIDMKTSLDIKTHPVHVLVEAEYFNYMSGVGHIRAMPGSHRIPREIQLRQGFIDGFVYNWDEISFDRFRAGFDVGSLEAGNGYLSWARNLKYELEARIGLPAGSNAVSTTTGGMVQGPLTVAVNGRGDRSNPEFVARIDSPALSVGGVDLGQVHVGASGGRDENGLYRFFDVAVEARRGDSSVALSEGVFNPDPGLDDMDWGSTFQLDVSKVNVAALMRQLGLKVGSQAVPIPGVISGSLRLSASGKRTPDGPGPVDTGSELHFGVEGNVSGRLSRRGVLDGRTFDLAVSGSVSGKHPTRPSVVLSDLRLRSGEDELDARGTVDIAGGSLSVTGRVSKNIKSLMRPFGVDMEGTIDLEDLRLEGRPSSPSGSAMAVLTGFAFKGWDVSSASAAVSLNQGRLDLAGLKAATGFARAEVDSASVFVPTLAGAGQAGRVSLDGVRLSAVDLAGIHFLNNVKGTGHGTAGHIGFSLDDPARTMTADAVLHLDRLEAAGRSLEFVTVRADVENGRAGELAGDALVRGGGSLNVRGSWDFARDSMDLTGELKNVPLKTLLALKPGSTFAGIVSASVHASGRPSDPAVTGQVELKDLSYGDYRIAPVAFGATRLPGQDLMLSSGGLFRAATLGPDSRVIWHDGAFTGLALDFKVRELAPQDVIPSIPLRKLSGALTASLLVEVPSFRDGRLVARMDSPPGGLWLDFMSLQTRVENTEALSVRLEPDGRLLVSGLTLDDGTDAVTACGEYGSSGLKAMIRGTVGAHWLRALKGAFSNADGNISLSGRPRSGVPVPGGCPASMLDGDGSMSFSGSPENPLFDGVIRTGTVNLNVRNWGDQVAIESGGEIVLSPYREGSGETFTEIRIPDDHWLSGLVGDGSFNLSGVTYLRQGRLENGEVRLNGSQVRYVSTGQYYFVAEPRLVGRFAKIGLFPGTALASTDAGITISGQVDITDGSYHKNFNVVRRAFSGMTGDRVAERTAGSILTAVPWLADAGLNIAVRASSFGLRTRLVVGETDLDLGINLNLRGTLRYPELWNRIEVLPGGTFTYSVVRREFEVSRGTVDFDGDFEHPQLDVVARTYIEYSGSSGSVISASRFSPDDNNDSFYGDMIQVNLALSGRYPDLDIQITSPTRGISQNDLQVLLLTGIAPGESVGEGTGSFVNVDLLTGNVTDSLVKVLLADLVDSVSFGVTAAGDVNLDVSAHVGRRLKFQTQVQQGAGTSQYSTGFKIRLTEGLSLEGRLRAVEYSVDQEDVGRNYDTRLRYRIPIE